MRQFLSEFAATPKVRRSCAVRRERPLLKWILGAFLTIVVIDLCLAQQKRPGCEVIVYIDHNFVGESWRTSDDQAALGRWNDQVSSIIVVSGIWDFFWDGQYRGEVITFPPGAVPTVGNRWNDQISSFRCARPTN